MKLGVRGHDLISSITNPGELAIKLKEYRLDTLQLVCHKSFEDVLYTSGSMNRRKALSIGESFRNSNTDVTLIGAYFNPVHPVKEKVDLGISVFEDNFYLAKVFGNGVVGSETGSFNGDKWTYHPQNRTNEALNAVIEIFSALSEKAAKQNVSVGIEGAAGHVCFNVETLKKAILKIGSGNIKVIFDYFNFMDESNLNYLHILDEGLQTFENIHCFHIKDCVIENKLKQCPVGKGGLDFKKILGMIKQYDKNAALILEGTVGGHIPSAAEYIREVWETV